MKATPIRYRVGFLYVRRCSPSALIVVVVYEVEDLMISQIAVAEAVVQVSQAS